MDTESKVEHLTRLESLRRLVAPLPPEPFYPTPWRVAEQDGNQWVVVCADGCYTCNAASREAADIIVAAVNVWACG